MFMMMMKNWKKVAVDRDEWAKLLKKARGPPRAVEPMTVMDNLHRQHQELL
jgi:hypothetical protein